MNILSDASVFLQIKDGSRKAYKNAWEQLKEFSSNHKFEEDVPGEVLLLEFFKFLREKKQLATSSIWTNYSYINSILKHKYGFKLQSYPRVTMLIKGFDTDVKKKAAIFEEEV